MKKETALAGLVSKDLTKFETWLIQMTQTFLLDSKTGGETRDSVTSQSTCSTCEHTFFKKLTAIIFELSLESFFLTAI